MSSIELTLRPTSLNSLDMVSSEVQQNTVYSSSVHEAWAQKKLQMMKGLRQFVIYKTECEKDIYAK